MPVPGNAMASLTCTAREDEEDQATIGPGRIPPRPPTFSSLTGCISVYNNNIHLLCRAAPMLKIT